MNHATRRPSSSGIVGRWAPFGRIPCRIPEASKASKSPGSLNSRSKTSGWPPRRSFTCRNSRGCSRLREWRPRWIVFSESQTKARGIVRPASGGPSTNGTGTCLLFHRPRRPTGAVHRAPGRLPRAKPPGARPALSARLNPPTERLGLDPHPSQERFSGLPPLPPHVDLSRAFLSGKPGDRRDGPSGSGLRPHRRGVPSGRSLPAPIRRPGRFPETPGPRKTGRAFGGAGGPGVPGPWTGGRPEDAAFAPCGRRLAPEAGGPAAVRRSLPRRPKPSSNFIPAGDAGRRAAAHPRLAGACPNGAPSLFRSPPPSCRPLAPLAGGVEGARAPSSGLRPRLRVHPRGVRGGSLGKRPGSSLPAPTAGWTQAGRPSIPWLCGEFLWEMARMIPDLRENSPETPRPKTPGLGRGRSGPGRSAIPWGQDRGAIAQSHQVPSLASLAPRPSRPRVLLLTLLLTLLLGWACPRPFTAPHTAGWSPFSRSRARRGRFSRSRPEKPGAPARP
jgi:hypothetical protein